jgi:hypothetical protein
MGSRDTPPRQYEALSDELRHLSRVHPILRQHEQLTLLVPDMALEQPAETVHLVVRARPYRRCFRPKLAMVTQQFALGPIASSQSPQQQRRVMMLGRKRNQICSDTHRHDVSETFLIYRSKRGLVRLARKRGLFFWGKLNLISSAHRVDFARRHGSRAIGCSRAKVRIGRAFLPWGLAGIRGLYPCPLELKTNA